VFFVFFVIFVVEYDVFGDGDALGLGREMQSSDPRF
jgi:hypothetical protein